MTVICLTGQKCHYFLTLANQAQSNPHENIYFRVTKVHVPKHDHSSLCKYLCPPPPCKSHSGTTPSQNEHMGLPTGLLTGTRSLRMLLASLKTPHTLPPSFH